MIERQLTPAEIDQYQQDGVVCVRNAVDTNWIQQLTEFGQHQLDHPSQLCNDNDSDKDSQQGRMFTDRYLWRTNEQIYRYAKESGCARLAAQAMQSKSSRFYFDHLLIKKANTSAPTHTMASGRPILAIQRTSNRIDMASINTCHSKRQCTRIRTRFS